MWFFNGVLATLLLAFSYLVIAGDVADIEFTGWLFALLPAIFVFINIILDHYYSYIWNIFGSIIWVFVWGFHVFTGTLLVAGVPYISGGAPHLEIFLHMFFVGVIANSIYFFFSIYKVVQSYLLKAGVE